MLTALCGGPFFLWLMRRKPAGPRPRRGMTGTRLVIDGVTLTAGAHRLVEDVSLTARPGEVIGLVGPNGSGKSSLLRAFYRVLRPVTGRVSVDGADVWWLPVRQLARTVAAVVQESGAEFDLTVHEVVAMGRTPHKRLFDGDTPEDAALITSALAAVDVTDLAQRAFDQLSGGESSACSSPALSPSSRPSWCWTNRPTTWTSATSWRSSAPCGGCPRRSWWPCTT